MTKTIVELLRIEANATAELHPEDSEIKVMLDAADRIEVLERELEQAAIRFEMMHRTLASLTGAALIGGENCRTPLTPK